MTACADARSSEHSGYEHLAGLFGALAALTPGSPERARLRERLIEGHLPLARHIARRYTRRGQDLDDLEQIAIVGLIGAVDRFDPWRGTNFLGFAIPTITGHIRRYFRDCTWSMRVPRGLKDLYLDIFRATTELSQHLGRAPNASELAAHLHRPREEILDGLQAVQAYQPVGLDGLGAEQEDGGSLGELLGRADEGFSQFEHRYTIGPLLAQLSERDRTILVLRFYGNQTQTQIAQRVGISQMQVSRLLAGILGRLREQLSSIEALA